MLWKVLPLCVAVEWGVFGMTRLIDSDPVMEKLEQHRELFLCGREFKDLPPKEKARVDEIRTCEFEIFNAPTVAAVPVSDLLALRDDLYEDDLITMRGLRDLNMLIAKYEGGKEK